MCKQKEETRQRIQVYYKMKLNYWNLIITELIYKHLFTFVFIYFMLFPKSEIGKLFFIVLLKKFLNLKFDFLSCKSKTR